MFDLYSGRWSSRLVSLRTEKIATTNTLELLMPAARGRSFAIAMSAPRNSPPHARCVNGPSRFGNCQVRGQFELKAAAIDGVIDANGRVVSRAGRDAHAAFRRAEQAAASCVVGVFAEDLDASRDEPAARARYAPRAEQALGRREKLLLASGLVLAHSGGDERVHDPSVHNETCKFLRRSPTAAISERRDKSSTPWVLRTILNRMPPFIASRTAAGSSYSPRDESGTRRQASKISCEKRQQFMLTSTKPRRATSVCSSGFSIRSIRKPAASTLAYANDRTRSREMLPCSISEPSSKITTPGSPMARRATRTSEGYRLSELMAMNSPPLANPSAASTASAVPRGFA